MGVVCLEGEDTEVGILSKQNNVNMAETIWIEINFDAIDFCWVPTIKKWFKRQFRWHKQTYLILHGVGSLHLENCKVGQKAGFFLGYEMKYKEGKIENIWLAGDTRPTLFGVRGTKK